MDRIMYILVVAMLISWLILILYWRYVQAFKAFMKDLNRISYRIQKKDFSVSTLVVTNNEKYITMANEAVLLPKEAEGVAGVFGMVVFSQLFACLLSLARGYNPDEPIGLSKTTVTF